MRRLKILLLLIVFFKPCHSQNFEFFQGLKNKYPDESIIQLISSVNIDINLVEDKLKVTEKFNEESILLKDDASNYNKYSVYSNSMVKLSNFTSKTKVLKGNSYKSFDNENIETINDMGSSSFYDDQKKHTVHINNLQKGSIRKLNYELNYEDAHFFGLFPLWNYIQTEIFEIKIKCAKTVDLELKYFNCTTEQNNMTITEDSKYKFYTLNLKNLPEHKTFNGSPNHKWYLPHLILYVKSYQTTSGKKNFLNDVSDLYNWYSSLIKNLPDLNSPELIKITDSLVRNVKNEKEKVKNVYLWVQKNIKYVAFEDGMGGYVPRDPSLVFQKKYGDCKDMAFLIYSMLNHANVKSYLTWIGTRSLPYSYSKVPTPLTNDHMIACYLDENKKPIFLDATDKFVSFGYPSAFIQGKQGLLGARGKFIDTIYVQIIPADKNIKTDSCFLKVDNLKLNGICKIYFNGYKRVDFLNDVSEQSMKKINDYYQREFMKGNNKFFQSDIKLESHLNDTTAFLGFNFVINDYITKMSGEQYINLNLEDDMPLTIFQEAYTTPYQLNYAFTNKYVKILEIPANYKAAFIPENYDQSTNDFGVSIKYEVKNNKIINTITFRVSTLLIEHKDLEKWNSFIAGINKQRNNTITLQLKN